jgi:DNA helicase-2/ATP-dependent DNA helicase PcrA
LDFCLPKIINFPKRNIGKETVKKLMALSKKLDVNCWEIINNCDNENKINEYKISQELSIKLFPFKKLITDLINFSETHNLYDTVEELLKLINIEQIKEETQKEQINLLLEKIKEMEQEYICLNNDKFTLSKFLEDFSLLIGNEEEETETKKDKVKLMTIHQAKGLEFKYVFIVGLEEEYYPCGAYIKDLEELEEERRIFYVAITRAKINCYLSYANERLINNELKKRNQSRFLSDIYNSKYIQKYDLDNNLNFKNYVDKGGSGSLNYFNNKEKGNNNNEIIYDIYNLKKSKKKDIKSIIMK